MSTKHQRSAPRGAVLLLTVCGLAGSSIRCDYGDYPLEPTFCDRWCRVLLRSNCDQEPEGCVRECERSLAPSKCSGLHDVLLACYEASPPSSFVCSEHGFQEIARPEESVCPGERDALIECAYPEVRRCLDFCRAFEAVYGAAGNDDAPSNTDAGPGSTCPSSDVPCDAMCWLAQAAFGEEVAEGDDSDPDNEPDDEPGVTRDAGPGDRSLATELFTCAIERAEACRSAAAGEPTLDGGAPIASANWASVVFGCAQQLGL